jgi:hypothetical protein
LLSRALIKHASVGERGVEPLEVRAPEHAKPLEIDDSHRHFWSAVIGEPKDLLGRARGDLGCSDNRERKGTPFGGAGRLEHGLGQKRHEAIGATFGSHLQLDGVGRSSSPQEEIGANVLPDGFEVDIPAGIFEELCQQGCRSPVAPSGARAPSNRYCAGHRLTPHFHHGQVN